METFERLESVVRSYSRAWPTVFSRACGEWLYGEDGTAYIDFFAGAGALNYGHNNPQLKRKLIEYLAGDNVVHGLDMATVAKREFLERFDEVVLKPRRLQYKVQFPGPTGTNSVEAALKLARKVTGRETIIGFTNAFHGMTLGALSVTGNSFKRDGAGVPLNQGVAMPYDGYLGDGTDTLDYFEAFLNDSGSGLGLPAAVIVETIQAEGGVNVAGDSWLQRLADLCRAHEMLLIADDIQVGCGRTGPFFSFEPARIQPDIICLSKSLSGYGLPLAVTLIKPELDVWEPGEHNGTFRGNNPAFVTATEALTYWENDAFSRSVAEKAALVEHRLHQIASSCPLAQLERRGKGLIQGLRSEVSGFAQEAAHEAFKRGLIIETSGPESQVIKLLPPLTIETQTLRQGLDIIQESVEAVAGRLLATAEPTHA